MSHSNLDKKGKKTVITKRCILLFQNLITVNRTHKSTDTSVERKVLASDRLTNYQSKIPFVVNMSRDLSINVG